VSIIRYRAVVERSGFSWSALWPGYLLAAFAALGLVLLLPGGPGRALVATPILLGVPGALTLGAVQARRLVDAAAFGGLAALLGVIWLVFAALLLNVLQVRISAVSMYGCLLVTCAILAAAAQWRLLRQGSAQPVADVLGAIDEPGGLPRRGAGYAVVAVSLSSLVVTFHAVDGARWEFSDAWVFAAVTSVGASLTEVIATGDAINHAILSEAEFTRAVPRLLAAGLI